jgi:starvation-inducible outer membrane lipoprotein
LLTGALACRKKHPRFTACPALPYIAPMKILLTLSVLLLLSACSTAPNREYTASDDQMNDLVMYTVSLADTPSRYGGN